jgi:phytanoyl-CoA hydroxylase
MHQDWRYFPTTDDRMVAAIIHLSRATADMGCIAAFPGSHRLGRMPSASGQPDYDGRDGYRAFAEQFPISQATVYEADPGDVLFISCLTIHGSGPNLSPDVRKTVLVQLYAGAAQLEESDHPVAGLVLRGWNPHATRSSAGRVSS